MNIIKFHCTIPIDPRHKPYLILQDPQGEFWMNHIPGFGYSPANSNAGMVSTAAHEIWKAKGVYPIIKIEDNLALF
jgi:hypothetical protein